MLVDVVEGLVCASEELEGYSYFNGEPMAIAEVFGDLVVTGDV